MGMDYPHSVDKQEELMADQLHHQSGASQFLWQAKRPHAGFRHRTNSQPAGDWTGCRLAARGVVRTGAGERKALTIS